MDESEATRKLSLALFGQIKPSCTELLNMVSSPGPLPELRTNRLLKELTDILDQHRKENTKSNELSLDPDLNSLVDSTRHISLAPYFISKKLADYIFVPISYLLKRPKLGDGTITQILTILAFLISNSWTIDVNLLLIDQLYPLVLYLAGGDMKLSQILQGPQELKVSAVKCLDAIVNTLPKAYFQDKTLLNRLNFMGNSITLLLDIITSTSSNAMEDTKLVNDSIGLIRNLSVHLSPDQLSNILPSITSRLISYTTSNNLHSSVIITILNTLNLIIVKVFSDESLSVVVRDRTPVNLQGVNEIWNDSSDLVEIQVSNEMVYRSQSWLRATSKQLKLSLVVLFRYLLMTSNVKERIKTKKRLQEEVLRFVQDITHYCFLSLFNEFFLLGIDIYGLVISIITTDDGDDKLLISEISSKVCNKNEQRNLVASHIVSKLNDLLESKFTSILLSTDEEKISSYFVAIKLHFSILHQLNHDISQLKLKLFNLLKKNLADSFGQKKARKRDIMEILHGVNGESKEEEKEPSPYDTSQNTLDDIELPPHIDAKKIARVTQPPPKQNFSSNLLVLADKIRSTKDLVKTESTLQSFPHFSSFIEGKIEDLIQFIGSFKAEQHLEMFEQILDDTDQDLKTRGVGLWIANNYLETFKNTNSQPDTDSFDIDEFLVFDEGPNTKSIAEVQATTPIDAELVEISYLMMSKSQDLFNDISFDSIGSDEFAYGVAIDSIGRLSNCLSMVDFQSDFLISYLYPLLDALTYQLNPSLQLHAKQALQLIITNYYGGSLEKLLVDNLDYLIDSISLKLTSTASLTPSLPGILLIILKITGMQLLVNNQLNDILNEMFVLIDSYHGYSVLVEGFFIVFEEIIKQIGEKFMMTQGKLINSSSSYGPWNMTSTSELLKLLEDTEKIIEPDYDSTKEYFRKPNTPFGDQADSDDEEEEEKEEPLETPEPWPSPITESIYFIIQRIYKYGFTLLNHQSNTLKVQILTTLKHCHPLLCTNYKLVMPLLSNNFPHLLTLITGASSLSSNQLADINENVIVPSLEFMLVVLTEDLKQPIKFLGKKFIDSWEFIHKYSTLFKSEKKKSTELAKTETQLSRHLNPKMLDLYVRYFTLGLEVYDNEIPDVLRYDILKFCTQLGYDKTSLCRNINNTLWVINKQV